MVPIQRHLAQAGWITTRVVDLGGNFQEERVVVEGPPPQEHLSDNDLYYLDEAIFHYWDKTARETSDESHGVIWRTHTDRQRLPYELALLSDAEPPPEQANKLSVLGQMRRWQSA